MTSRQWIVLLAAAVAVRVLVAAVLLGDWPITSDAERYVNEASALAKSFERSEPYYFPAGLIWLLAAAYALFGSDIGVTRAVTIALSVLAVPFVVRLTRELSDDPRAPRLAGWIAAFYPASLLSSGYPGSQSLGYPTLVAAAFLFLSAWRLRSVGRAAAAGAVLGVFSLARSSGFTVVFALGALWCVRLYLERREPELRAKLALGAAALAAWIALISPVLVHHVRLGEGLTLATYDAWNLFAGNNKYTPLYRTGYLGHRRLAAFPPHITKYLAELQYAPVDARGGMRREVIAYVSEHPFATALRTVNRARAFWGFDHANSTMIQRDLGVSELALFGLLLFEAGGYAVVAVLALLAMFLARDRLRAGSAGVVLLMIAGYQVAFLIAISHPTYHAPVLPLLMPFAALSAARVLESPGSGAALLRSRGAWLALAAFAAMQVEYGYFALLYR